MLNSLLLWVPPVTLLSLFPILSLQVYLIEDPAYKKMLLALVLLTGSFKVLIFLIFHEMNTAFVGRKEITEPIAAVILSCTEVRIHKFSF